MTDQPPSYAPRSRRARPSEAGAEHVGSGTVPSASRSTRRISQQDIDAVLGSEASSPRSQAQPRRAAPAASAGASASRPQVRRRSIMPAGSSDAPQASQYGQADYRRPAAASGAMPESIAPARRAAAQPQAHVSAEAAAAPRAYVPRSQAQGEARPRPARNAEPPELAMSSLPSKVDGAVRRLPRPRLPRKSIVLLLLVLLIAWPVFLFYYGNSKMTHMDALSGRPATAGNTYLIVGSDKREAGVLDDGWEGQRADSIMLLQLPEHGNSSLVSIPRDTLVDIPGQGKAKINASYAYGGAPLLVQTVEELTGLTVDHYIEVSMGGVQQLVDAVDGVELCYDYDVDDANSGMKWQAGCHVVQGPEALAFSRMRYSDPQGDIGRQARQRQVVKQVIKKAVSPSTLLRPDRQYNLVGTAATNLAADRDSSLIDLGQAGLGLSTVMGDDGLMGTPPIADLGYWYNGQSCVLLDPNKIGDFWARMRDGQLTKEDFVQGTS